jgi:transglutaminase-like putative cysteine protease
MSRRRPDVLNRPEQGWSSLLLLLGMLLLLGLSVADLRPFVVIEDGSLTDSLPVVILAGGLVGFLLARSSLGVVRAHIIGATVAALVLLLVAGGWLIDGSPLPLSLEAVRGRVSAVWLELTGDLAGEVTTYLVMAAICWTTAQFGAFSVFRYGRGGPAVMAVGTVLFLNVSLGSFQDETDRLPVVPVLAAFAAMALLLLMRLQLVQQRYAWARRHISDTRDVSRLFIRSGVAFVLIAVLSASSLTAWATVRTQDISIDGLDEPFEDLVDELTNVLDFFGVPRSTDLQPPLGRTAQLSTVWDPGEGLAFSAEFEEGRLRGNYWWGAAYDRYDYQNERWQTTAARRELVPADTPITTEREARTGGEHQARVSVEVGPGNARTNLFRLPDVAQVETHDVTVRLTDGGGVSDIEYPVLLREDDDVVFRSSVLDYEDGSPDISASALRAAGDADPPWVRDLYLQGADDEEIVGPLTTAMAKRIKESHRTRFDRALAVQDELRDTGEYQYQVDLGRRCDPFDAVPECLLTIREGFCQQYATTMVMIMRKMGDPARFVTGYLPGEEVENGVWEVPQQAFHNWVEVYFPDVGWVRFDPTPGLDDFGQVPTERIDEEAPPPESSAPPEPAVDPEESFEPEPSESPGPGGAVIDRPPGGDDRIAVFVTAAGVAALLLTVISVLLLYRIRRLPAGDESLAYLGIVSLATRLGYGPHPSQTEYEYAGTLAEVVPTVRQDLYVVTDAQVETAYGGRRLGDGRRGALREAYARIRTALLRLALRLRR